MAKELKPIGRQISLPTQTVQAGNAFEKMGEAAGQMGELLSSKLSSVAAEQAAQQGVKAAEEGTAPKDLAPPLTPATQKFNDAVADTEANRMIIAANAQMSQSLMNHTNPANFNSQSPAAFNAELDGIVQGTLENVRDENRGKITKALQSMASNASLKMLQHSMNFDNKKMQHDFSTTIETLTNERQNAVIAGDDEMVTSIDFLIDDEMKNFGDMNEAIKNKLPEVRDQLEKKKTIQDQLGQFSKAQSEGKGAEFLANFTQNKANLPFDVWQDASKKLMDLDTSQKKMTNEIRAQEAQQVSNAINNNTLTDVDDILDFPNLTTNQQLNLMGQLEKHQQQNARQQNKFLQAQNNMLRGTAATISGDTINEMFDTSRAQFEENTGQVASVFDMEKSIFGENDAPVSGIKRLPAGRAVPKFNSQLKSMLTSGNPDQVAAAAAVFNDITNVRKKSNMVELSGDALAIATSYNTLNTGGQAPREIAQKVQESVLSRSDSTIKERNESFNREFRVRQNGASKADDVFKNLFGTNHQIGVNDAAFGAMKENMKINFLKTGSEEASIEATRYEMRNWDQSKWFDEGMIANGAPEKELPNITEMGHAFQNQLNSRLQLYIDKNAELEAKDKRIDIDWEKPSVQSIDLKNLTDEDRVFKPLGTTLAQGGGVLGSAEQEAVPKGALQGKPRVKINGEPTQVYLQTTADTRLGDRLQYALYYKDRFGMPQPLPDRIDPTGVAHFAPDNLQNYAPSVMDEKRQEQLKQTAVDLTKEQAKQEWQSIGGLGALGKIFPGFDRAAKFFREPEKSREVFRKMMAGDDQEARQIVKLEAQKLEGKDKQKSPEQKLASASEKAGEAKHVGISANPDRTKR